MSNLSLAAKILRFADPYLKILVLASVGLYIAELLTGAKHSYEAFRLFLWTERLVAVIFTLEYLLRWWDDASDQHGWHYPHSPLGLIDLVSILPFWIGFFVPVEWLHFIRTFRIFRLLKFFRYSRGLQLVALGFYRAWPHMKLLGFALSIVGLFCIVAMHEAESEAQPDKFGDLFSSAWFAAVTMATVGYGDAFPVTPLGKLVAMICFFFALAIFAAALSVIGGSVTKVLDEEIHPDIDPIDIYRREKLERLARRTARKGFGPNYEKNDKGSLPEPSSGSPDGSLSESPQEVGA